MPDETDTPNPPETPGESGPSALSGTPLYAANERITKINVADEIKNSFLDYSMSVIISRALADVRDGLKPSQRRILFAMHELSLFPGRKPYKCAKICGDTSGDYHPHGEAVIYPTLVHMAQPWAMRERLIEGKGNFGSVENDPPAAMRYTEARLTHLGAALLQDMDKDTVTIPELMKFIKGPDFPTGGFLCGVEGIKNYFTGGRGSVKLRGRIGVEEM